MLDKTLQLRSPRRAMLGERTNRAARFSSPAFPATPQHAQSCLQHSCTDGHDIWIHMDIPRAIYLALLLSKRQKNSSKFNKQTKMLSSISDATAGTNESSQCVSSSWSIHYNILKSFSFSALTTSWTRGAPCASCDQAVHWDYWDYKCLWNVWDFQTRGTCQEGPLLVIHLHPLHPMVTSWLYNSRGHSAKHIQTPIVILRIQSIATCHDCLWKSSKASAVLFDSLAWHLCQSKMRQQWCGLTSTLRSGTKTLLQQL